MSKKPNHLHRLKMHKYKNGTEIYFCTLPDCYYKAETHLTVGKIVLCNLCQQPFTMTERTAKLLRPHCPNCGKQRVIDADGKNRYIRKVGNRVSNMMSIDTVNKLRSRLDSLTHDEAEEDI
jgi:hypothetical protein